MARKLRIQYPGAIYHVMNRGDRREPIFHDDYDRENFLKTLAQACEKTDWLVHAWCLMGNHFHLVVVKEEHGVTSSLLTIATRSGFGRMARSLRYLRQGGWRLITGQA